MFSLTLKVLLGVKVLVKTKLFCSKTLQGLEKSITFALSKRKK